MIKQKIKYTNFNNETVEEEFYFHLSKVEALKLEFGSKGGMEAALQELIAREDLGALFEIFLKLLRVSVGKRSVDGRLFLKTPETVNEFEGSGAADELVLQLMKDSEFAKQFMAGVLPADIQKEAITKFEMPAEKPTIKPKVSLEDLRAMSPEDFAAIQTKV